MSFEVCFLISTILVFVVSICVLTPLPWRHASQAIYLFTKGPNDSWDETFEESSFFVIFAQTFLRPAGPSSKLGIYRFFQFSDGPLLNKFCFGLALKH